MGDDKPHRDFRQKLSSFGVSSGGECSEIARSLHDDRATSTNIGGNTDTNNAGFSGFYFIFFFFLFPYRVLDTGEELEDFLQPSRHCRYL